MAISFVSVSTSTYASRTNLTVTAPASIANNDILLAIIAVELITEAPDITAIPSGWTQIGTKTDISQDGHNIESYCYWKRAASESGNYTWNHATATSQATMLCLRGVDTTTAIDATTTTNSGLSTTTTWTGLTTATNAAWIVALSHDWGNNANDLTAPTGMTERSDSIIIYSATQEITTAGATGNKTHTNRNGGFLHPFAAFLVALRPAAGGTAGNASGGTITVAGSLISGAGSGVRSPTVTGATLPAAGSLVAGTASGIRNPTVAGQVLTTAASLTAGTASGIRSPTVSGSTLTVAGSIVAGSASSTATGTANGATITAPASLLAGTASGIRSPTVTGQVLTRAATFIAGSAAAGVTIYVRKTGNNTTGTGTSANPYLTMEKGIDESTMPGTVVVGNGTYNESLYLPSGLTLRAENPGMVLLRTSTGNAITGDGINNVEIDGLDIRSTAANCHGIEIKSSHHITIRNVISHENANSGISLPWGEFLTVEDCTCYGNGRGGWYSGITFYQSRNITGDTTTPGPRNVIRNCLSYDNWTTGGSTDGNGILIDDWQHTQAYGPDPEDWQDVSYPYGGLVENCIAYGNGNKGIGIAWSNGITIRNNTCYKNGIDGSQGTWRGDLSNQAGLSNTFANNIAVADSSGAGQRSANTAIGNYANGANGETCAGTIWFNNLTYNTNSTGSSSLNITGPGCATPTVGDGNKLATNPLFVNAAAFDFHLQASSPCLNAGTAAYGLPANDNEGNPRISGAAVDIGAFEYDTGIATAAGATLTAPASLIAGAASSSRTITGATLTVVASITAGTASVSAAGTANGATLPAVGSLLSGSASASRTVSGTTLTAAGALTAGAATAAAIAAGQILVRAATLTGGIATGGGSASVPGATWTVATTLIAGTVSTVRNPTVAGVTITTAGTIIAGTAQAGAGATAFGALLSRAATLTAGTAQGNAATPARTITVAGAIVAGAASGTATVSGQVFTRAASMLPGSANGAGGATVPGIIQTAGLSLIAGTASATSSATAAGVTLSVAASFWTGTAAAPRITQVRAPLGYYRPVVEQTAERPEATSPSRSGALQTARRT